jgi:hypothetical protein
MDVHDLLCAVIVSKDFFGNSRQHINIQMYVSMISFHSSHCNSIQIPRSNKLTADEFGSCQNTKKNILFLPRLYHVVHNFSNCQNRTPHTAHRKRKLGSRNFYTDNVEHNLLT